MAGVRPQPSGFRRSGWSWTRSTSGRRGLALRPVDPAADPAGGHRAEGRLLSVVGLGTDHRRASGAWPRCSTATATVSSPAASGPANCRLATRRATRSGALAGALGGQGGLSEGPGHRCPRHSLPGHRGRRGGSGGPVDSALHGRGRDGLCGQRGRRTVHLSLSHERRLRPGHGHPRS